MKLIYPIIAIVAAVIIFFGPISNTLKGRAELNEKIAGLEEALINVKLIQDKRDQLQTKYNNFSTDDLERLRKLLPSHVDNVRLVIDINEIASKYNMILKGINVQTTETDEEKINVSEEQLQTIDLGFSVSGNYESLKLFMDDLSRSLRLVDVVGISFDSENFDFYDYEILLRTYWLPSVQ